MVSAVPLPPCVQACMIETDVRLLNVKTIQIELLKGEVT